MKMLSRGFGFFILCWLALPAIAQAQGVLVKDAWIRGVPPSATSTAAFMIIENTGPAEMVLQSAACEIAEVVQIHTMKQVGEMMMMKEIGELRVPANAETALAPKGYHIMLIGLVRPLNEGETIPLSLGFTDRATVAVDAVVKKWGPMPPMSHH